MVIAYIDLSNLLALILVIYLVDAADVFLTFCLMMTQEHVRLLLDGLITQPFVVVHAPCASHFAVVAPTAVVVVEALALLLVVPLICLSKFETDVLGVLFACSVLIQEHACD